jgi:hypothetical protein
MPQVTLRVETTDGKEATLTEYLCDWPDCPNIAVHDLGILVELRARSVVCSQHAEMLKKQARG